jgi:hypothetical protein
MLKSLPLAAAFVAAAALPLHAAEPTSQLTPQLTLQETRWLHAAAPVLNYSRQIALPVDIVVQPQANPGAVPLAMGFAKGRCKLVLSMRGNPDAEKVLAGVPAADQPRLIEAMAAHELAHCWRYAQGEWHALPAGFVEVNRESARDPGLLAASKAMRETRREEGFADLAALAWIGRSHPDDYGRVHDWLSRVRAAVATPNSGHDTRVWVRLAEDGAQFDPGLTPFEAAQALWQKGLVQ